MYVCMYVKGQIELLNTIINNYWTRLSKISSFVSGEQINYLPKAKAEAIIDRRLHNNAPIPENNGSAE